MVDISNPTSSAVSAPESSSGNNASGEPKGTNLLGKLPNDLLKNKKGRKLRRKILFGVLAGFIVLTVLVNFALKTHREVVSVNPKFIVKESTESEKPIVETPVPTLVTFDLTDYGLKFTYPQDLYIERNNPFSQDPPTFKVIYKGTRQPDGLITEANLLDGYIFKVIIYPNPTDRDISALVATKRKNYTFNCNDNAQVSLAYPVQVDSLSGFGFLVSNCLSDYKETLVSSNNYIYEFVQEYRGDIGYKQKYEKGTDELLASVVMNKEAPLPESPFVTFSDETYKFEFTHPRLDTTCCHVPEPFEYPAEASWYFASVPGSLPTSGKPFDGFGIFIDKLKGDTTYASYLDAQKASLKTLYTLTTGKSPENSKASEIKVGNLTGTLLENYAWWGDVIYVQLPNTTKVMVISKTEYLPGSFKELFNSILATFKFKEK